jgi:AraC-like DNA-binding protein
MTVVLRADTEPVRSRMDYWRHVVGDSLQPVDMRLDGGPDFHARLLTGELGAVEVVEVTTADPGEALRTRRLIRRSDADRYAVDVLVRGSAVIEQDGRHSALGPGDLTFIDPSRPFRWTHSPHEFVSVVLPRTLLPVRRDELRGITGTRIPGDAGVGALVSSLVRRLPGQLDSCDPATGARLGTSVADLVTVALAASLDRQREIPHGTRRNALLTRIHAFVDERLADPGLSPATIAAAHHISVRYLHKLFESEHRTVAGLIRHRRLERCRRDLLDPAMADRPVAAVGARWGLPDPAHLSRAFRNEYGLPPLEYRRLHGRA